MIHRRVSREVTSITSVRAPPVFLYGKAPYFTRVWTDLLGVRVEFNTSYRDLFLIREIGLACRQEWRLRKP